MTTNDTAHRRSFLGRLALATAAVGLPWTTSRQAQAAQARQSGPEWLKEVPGTHRCLFDCPRHMMGFGLVHIFNYLNTYSAAYKLGRGQVGAVSTFYSLGSDASIAMAFNDAMWAKYRLGEYTGLKDAKGVPYTRNVFHRPTADDRHLLTSAARLPDLAMFGDLFAGAGIANLQAMGTKFLLCNNALQAWTFELEARGKGQAPTIDADLRANVLPGVTIVPAMVIAIEEAQAAGISYNRQ